MLILTTAETMKMFQIGSQDTMLQLFKMKDSPAFKVGKNWRVDAEKFEKFLQEQCKTLKS